MAKGNRNEARGSHQVRVSPDLGEMISWIIRLEGGTTVQLLDPMIRVQIVARYTKHAAAVERIREAEQALREVENAAKLQGERDAEGAHPKPLAARKKRAE